MNEKLSAVNAARPSKFGGKKREGRSHLDETNYLFKTVGGKPALMMALSSMPSQFYLFKIEAGEFDLSSTTHPKFLKHRQEILDAAEAGFFDRDKISADALIEQFCLIVDHLQPDCSVGAPYLSAKGIYHYNPYKPTTSQKAKEHPQVDAFLREFAGDEVTWRRLRQWFAHCPSLVHGIPALFMIGPRGTGKTTLMEAAANITGAGYASRDVMFGDRPHKDTLLRTPFVFVDEGLPKSIREVADLSDQIKSMVTGTSYSVNPKGRVEVTINHVKFRMVFAANDTKTIDKLKELIAHDTDSTHAICERLFIIRVPNCHNALSRLYADFGLTGVPEATRRMREILEQHFLWLAQNRMNARERLDSAVIDAIDARLTVSIPVTETLMKLQEFECTATPAVTRVVESLIDDALDAVEAGDIGQGKLVRKVGSGWLYLDGDQVAKRRGIHIRNKEMASQLKSLGCSKRSVYLEGGKSVKLWAYQDPQPGRQARPKAPASSDIIPRAASDARGASSEGAAITDERPDPF